MADTIQFQAAIMSHDVVALIANGWIIILFISSTASHICREGGIIGMIGSIGRVSNVGHGGMCLSCT
jgi:hypothetical protein